MSLASWFSDKYAKQAQQYVFAPIPPDRSDNPFKEVEISAEAHYFRVWLAEMFLCDDRRLFRGFVPVVHSVVRLQFAGNPAQELPYVAGPQNVGLGTTLGKGVQINHPLTNLLPFRGGTVSVAAGLFAYEKKDFFEGFMEILHDVSGLFNAGQLSLALGVADKAIDGIQNLLGASDKDVHVIYFEGFGGTKESGGAPLTSGYKAVISANAKSFERDSRLHFGSSLEEARPLEGYDYMLLRIEAATKRDDYLSFVEFAKLLQDAIKEGSKNKATGDSIIETARVAAFSSPDLTQLDKARVARALWTAYQEAMTVKPVSGTEELREISGSLAQRIEAGPTTEEVKKKLGLLGGGSLSLQTFLEETKK